MSDKLGCDFQEPWFGASYPDACCSDGYLWDLDSCDEPGGPLFIGGDDPCPRCNHEEYLGRVLEDIAEEGAIAACDHKPREFPLKSLRFEQPGDLDKCREAWLRGYDEELKK